LPVNAILPRIVAHRLTIAVHLLVLLAALAVSIGTMFMFQSGPLMLGWCVVWAVGAAISGYRFRSWIWPIFCPVAMLLAIMMWEVVYGRNSWASTYVLMLGVAYAVAATIGALVGTWLGKRRSGRDANVN
jgi:hypothetical protein